MAQTEFTGRLAEVSFNPGAGAITLEGDDDEADPTLAGDGSDAPAETIPADGGTPPSPESTDSTLGT